MVTRVAPLSTQIFRELLSDIKSGAYGGEGSMLPSETELCQRYDVSRGTIREALFKIEQMGIITRYQGKGTFINSIPNLLESNLGLMEGFDELAKRTGVDINCANARLEERNPTSKEIIALDVLPQDMVLIYSRLIRVGKQTVAYLTDVFSEKVIQKDKFPIHTPPCSIWDILRKLDGLLLTNAQTNITVEPAPDEIAKQLGVNPTDLLLKLEARIFSSDNRVRVYSNSYFIPGTFKFTLIRSIH